MSDHRLIKHIALEWFIHDGDSEGFAYCSNRIIEEIKKMEESAKLDDERENDYNQEHLA